MWAYCICGRVRPQSPQSDLSVVELCDNTNILSTARTHTFKREAADMRKGRRENFCICFHLALFGIYSSSLSNVRIYWSFLVHQPGRLCVFSPSQQMSSLRFFQEQCLRRCIQETVAGAHFLCDRCAMEAWQLLSCSLFPSLYSSLLFLPLSSQLQQRAALFVLTSPLLPADLWSTKDLDLTLATHTHAHTDTHTAATAASPSFLLISPGVFTCVWIVAACSPPGVSRYYASCTATNLTLSCHLQLR